MKEEIDVYESETGQSWNPKHEIHVVFSNNEDMIYESININEFDHAATLLDVSKEDILKLYIAALVRYDFKISLAQFMWILVGDKTEAEAARLFNDGILDLLNELYAEIHYFHEDTAWIPEIKRKYRSKKSFKELTPEIQPKDYLEQKRDEYHKYE